MLSKKIVFKNQSTERVDSYLAKKYPSFSRRYFQNALKNKKILVNQEEKSPSYKLKNGDSIEINLSLKKPASIQKLPPNDKVSFSVVAKYPDFLIIDKPAGLTVHPSIFDIQNHSLPPTLAGGLIAKFPELENVGEDFSRPGIVHRLDKETFGLMIVPRTQEAFLEFKKMFRHHQIKKTYLALSWNFSKQKTRNKSILSPEKHPYKIIKSYIGKSKADHTKQVTSTNPARLINPKEALTLYKIIAKKELPCFYKVGKLKKHKKEVLLVKAQPQTGRKHQIRVHLSSVGLPLVGDKKYTNKIIKNCNKNFPHHFLQAQKLEFDYRGKKYSFTSKQKPVEFD